MIFSFVLFLVLFAFIGMSTIFKSKKTKKDYYLASGSVSAPLVGLSAVATNSSGYMFIGVIGYTYATGLSSMWLMIGWIVGDFLSSLFIHSRLKKATDRTGEVSFAGVLSSWNGKSSKTVARVVAAISLLFLLAYASAQLVAGSKALHVMLGWPEWAGATIGAGLVTLYCISGGIRASIWTDAAQSIVMIVAMGILLFTGVSHIGGFDTAIFKMNEVPGYLDLFPKDLVIPGVAGIVLFVFGWCVAGFSVIGQPHIMVRFMTLKDNSQMVKAKTWYYLWFLIFWAMSTGVGLLSRIYITNTAAFDAELALPTMARDLLSPGMAGLVLAGIFAATISTADSLVLSCSSAVTHDLLPHKIERPALLKIGTAVITLIALSIALFNTQSVFSLVIMSWSALGSAFGPLILFLAMGYKPQKNAILLAIFSSLIVVFVWRYFGLHDAVYEGFPASLLGIAILYSSKLTQKKVKA